MLVGRKVTYSWREEEWDRESTGEDMAPDLGCEG
jgi:hypothetical protein